MDWLEATAMNKVLAFNSGSDHIAAEIRGKTGFITLNRPAALNALSLPMIRAITRCMLAWRDDDAIHAVAMRGVSKAGPFGAFCAGGDIRFFHQAVQAGNPELEDFFTEEYTLNHLVHTYPKPTIAFMDGVVMGGGMGISQGCSLRLVTENTKMAMPETQIGLFPDVGGGYFLSRCPGHIGEWLALTGETISPRDAVVFGLADRCVVAASMPAIWEMLASCDVGNRAVLAELIAPFTVPSTTQTAGFSDAIESHFSFDSVTEIVRSLEADVSPWAQKTALQLRQKSPLMLHVSLAQIRRGRSMALAQDLRMERDMMRHCFNPLHLNLSAKQSETVEGIRAQAIDKDRSPKWHPAKIEDVTPAMVAPFFESPWPVQAHPLGGLV
jgi:enoyl-CoA hydratase/carnithine racemase